MVLQQGGRNKYNISLNRLSLTTDFFCANLNPYPSRDYKQN